MRSVLRTRRPCRARRRGRAAGVLVAVVALAALTGCGDGSDDSATSDREGTATSTRAPSSGPSTETCPRGGTPARDVRFATVAGVAPDLLSLDVYPPTTGCPAPVVVWVHGGGFRVGDKANQLAHKMRLFHDLGYVLVSVNYRLTRPDTPEPVQYPTHADDVAAALAWIDAHIDRYGGDPERIAVLGHSAGAQLVATLATDERRLRPHGLGLDDLACVAPLDTEGFDIERLGRRGVGISLDAFGTDPAVWADASPIRHVVAGTGIPPHLLVRRGSAARRSVLAEYEAALTAAGVPVTTIDASSLGHRDVSSLIGAPGDTVMTEPLTAFLAGCFAGR